MPSEKIVTLSEYAQSANTAPKAMGIHWLSQHKVKTPKTWVWGGFPDDTLSESDLSPLAGHEHTEWAVRSASLIEDGNTQSFAGQFETLLNVHGAANLFEAATKVRQSHRNARLAAYQKDQAKSASDTQVHVLFQEMVKAQWAGVSFSKNPVTGFNEIIIEAVVGLGDNLVDHGADPMRWTYRGGQAILEPEKTDLPTKITTEIARETARLAKHWGAPIDLEWAFDGETLWFLQIRPITGLDRIKLYSNRISKEVMPGRIKPLVWSINIPLVNGAWIDLIERVTGPSNLQPDQLAKQFAFRSYFNMGAMGQIFESLGMPADALEIMLGLPNTPRPKFVAPQKALAKLPRAMATGFYIWRFEKNFRNQMDAILDDFSAYLRSMNLSGSPQQLIAQIDSLLPIIARTAHLNIVGPILANIYSTAFRRACAKADLNATQIDLTAGQKEFAQFDPKPSLLKLAHSDDSDHNDTLSDFMARFGHYSESGNDISVPHWSEQPDLVQQMIKSMANAQNAKAATDTIAIDPLDQMPRRVRRKGQRARKYQLMREEISFHYTKIYGQLRPLYLALGQHFVQKQYLKNAEEIFFLTDAELRETAENSGVAPDALKAKVQSRQREYAQSENVMMPELIFSDTFVPPPQTDDGLPINQITGTGSSSGQATGKLRHLKSTADFEKMKPGEIIAIPFSDVGWTPVFVQAAGVVSESGGMLSHSSIVARELGIPCIVSAKNLFSVPNGTQVHVDGSAGTLVAIGANNDQPEEQK